MKNKGKIIIWNMYVILTNKKYYSTNYLYRTFQLVTDTITKSIC